MIFSKQLFPGNSIAEIHYVIQVVFHKGLLKCKQCGISQWPNQQKENHII